MESNLAITVGLKKLQLQAIIGVHEHEQLAPQTLIVDIHYEVSLSKGIQEDDFEEVIDYSLVRREAIAFAQKKPYQLIEHFSYQLAKHLLDLFPIMKKVHISCDKPGAFIDTQSSSCQLSLEQGN